MTMERGHVAQLDGIRGLAILLVAVCHYAEDVRPQAALESTVIRLAQSGWIGVDLFFALSGYLITGILIDSRRSANYFLNFYVRRILRIAPLYYAALILYYSFVARHDDAARANPLWFLLYGTNILTATSGWPTRFLGHFWSLAVEEQFYLLWPVLVWVSSELKMFWICCGLWLGSVGARYWITSIYGPHAVMLYVLTPLHLDGLAAGSALAALTRSTTEVAVIGRWCRWMLGAGLVGMLSITLRKAGFFYWQWTSPLSQALGYTPLAVACAALIGVTLTNPETHWLNSIYRNRLLVRFGKYSYAIYVFHLWADRLARTFGTHPALLSPPFHSYVLSLSIYTTVQLALALAIGVVSWNLLEKHFLGLKDRFRDTSHGKARPRIRCGSAN